MGVMAKDERLDLRVSLTQKRLLQQAASISGRSVSEFVLDSALEDAGKALLDQRIFMFDPEAFDQLLARAEDVEKNKEAIDKILAISPPWQE